MGDQRKWIPQKMGNYRKWEAIKMGSHKKWEIIEWEGNGIFCSLKNNLIKLFFSLVFVQETKYCDNI